MASASVAKPIEPLPHASIDDMQVDSTQPDGEPDEDLYTQLKTLQRQLEFYEIQARSVAAQTPQPSFCGWTRARSCCCTEPAIRPSPPPAPQLGSVNPLGSLCKRAMRPCTLRRRRTTSRRSSGT